MRDSLLSPEEQLQGDVNALKDSSSYKEQYAETELQELKQALDILFRLRQAVAQDSSKLPWDKLYSASQHLEKLLKEHIERDQ